MWVAVDDNMRTVMSYNMFSTIEYLLSYPEKIETNRKINNALHVI